MKKIIFFILLILIISGAYKTLDEEITIPKESIRLRVIPNSNNGEDINIKEKVKKYLEKNIYQILKDTNNIVDARNKIEDNLPVIKKDINNIFNENDYNNEYKIKFGMNYFPEKKYKGIKYEEGMYESLVIEIGKAKGDNWWCVLFPNFCLADINEDVEYKSYIYNLAKKVIKIKK